MNKKSADEFAYWLMNEHPNIFAAILKKQQPSLSGLSDWSDVMSSIGDTASSALSSVGDFLTNPSNVNALSNVAVSYFKSQTPTIGIPQSAIFGTQLGLAQAGQPIAPITYAQNAQGQMVPVYMGNQTIPGLGAQIPLANGQMGYQVTPSALQSLSPSFLQKYGLMLAAGAVGLVAIIFISRR